ncbi:hypothetical protein [Kitasatospora sp. NBC_01302]|uniref:hypothetical protein n=1 Tax=Kitasatospora sp. NBC_01302 TaxID=2903575 RepID=UPI002E14D083|nr:hypothetical protein OG294_19890 [Kitasatospora sp. NBC_01302]
MIYTPAAELDGGVLTAYCRSYADERQWTVVAEITDPADPDTGLGGPLGDRLGWARVLSLLADGRAAGVITWTRRGITPDSSAYEALCAALRARGTFLVVGGHLASARLYPKQTEPALERTGATS